MERRLAAILAADVVGYSRLIGADESGTLSILRALHNDLLAPKIASHRGRIVKLLGDGLLAEFASVIDAVTAAVEIQESVSDFSEGRPNDQRVALRIGINIGDVVMEDGDIFGDGVNVAARLQEIAAPDGMAVSESVHRELRGKLDLPFTDAGEMELKNIAGPVRTWLWLSTGKPASGPEKSPEFALPDKPSIVVLPFDNFSEDPEQAHFADGMTEDIITALSRFRWLFVIARTTSNTFQGRAMDVRAIANDLGVRYVLEGSVRKRGGKVRVTAQLIDATLGSHIWAENYDCELEKIFEVQDEIRDALVAAIAPEIDGAERERSLRKRPDSLDAWDLYQRGLSASLLNTKAGLSSAIEFLDKAVASDGSFAPAIATAATVRLEFVQHFRPDDADAIIEQAQNLARNALAADARDPICLLADARIHSHFKRHDIGIVKTREAIQLNPNFASAHYQLGYELFHAGEPEQSIPPIDQAIRLSPRDANLGAFQHARAEALFELERYEECAEWARRSAHGPNPKFPIFAVLAIALKKIGQDEESQWAIDRLFEMVPEFSLRFVRRALVDHDPVRLENILAHLREVGIPE